MDDAPTPATAPDFVTILLASHQGAAHLPGQLASIAAQSHEDWALWVSDDGSTDGTRDLVADFARSVPQTVRLVEGPRRGAAANFLSLLCHPDLPEGPVALCDQDDLWYPDKLARAVAHLAAAPPTTVYSAQSRHIGDDGTPLGRSRVHGGVPSFGNALVQNRVSGHSAVLSAGALALVRAVGPVDVPFHDWWLYQLIAGAGGAVRVDDAVVLDYRQHGQNVLGAHRGRAASLRRAALMLGPTYRGWMAANRAAILSVSPFLTMDARLVLEGLSHAPRAGVGRARAFARLGLTRDRAVDTAFLRLAAVLGRV